MEHCGIFSPCTSRTANMRRVGQGYLKSGNNWANAPIDMGARTGRSVGKSTRTDCEDRETSGHAYISEVARRYRERIQKLKERSRLSDNGNESTCVTLIVQRLLYLVGECDIDRATCCVPMCGRIFTTVQVLAWHMSYSHHDLASNSAYGTLCFVCGIRMDTVKGKTIHLMSKHKELYLSHNEQCVYQRLPVISPLAPAAVRIAQCAVDDYSREQMFDIVADVSHYQCFIPWCRHSSVLKENENWRLVELEIGFPPMLERYRSRVTLVRPSVVHSIVVDDSVFNTLETTFRFAEGKPLNQQSCTLDYNLLFEFKSALHSYMAHLFFDQVVRTMVEAFLTRAEEVHGKPSVPHSPPTVLRYQN